MTDAKTIAAGLTARLAAETAKKVERERADHARVEAGAIAFDEHAAACGYAGKLPHLLTAAQLYGDNVTLFFEDVAPDEALALMEAFPSVTSVYHNDGQYKRLRPEASLTAVERVKPDAIITPIDGYRLEFDGGAGYGQTLRLEWSAVLANRVQAAMRLTLRPIGGITPNIHANIEPDGQGRVVRVRSCDLRMPLPGPVKLTEIKYSRGGSETAFNHFVLYSTSAQGMRGTVKTWADRCEQIGRDSRAAYLKDKAGGLGPSEIRGESRPYAERSLRAGTERQTAALESVEALQDRALAEKHWRQYAADSELYRPVLGKDDKPRDYFDHYAWACSYLARLGCLEDEHNGKPYRYGSAWL